MKKVYYRLKKKGRILILHELWVAPDQRSKGLGSLWLQEMLKSLRVSVIDKVVIFSPVRAAVPFYKKNGFDWEDGVLTITLNK
jgi:GNAT superfamily N-acetyltransferase